MTAKDAGRSVRERIHRLVAGVQTMFRRSGDGFVLVPDSGFARRRTVDYLGIWVTSQARDWPFGTEIDDLVLSEEMEKAFKDAKACRESVRAFVRISPPVEVSPMQNGLPAKCGVLAIEVPRSGAVLRHGGLQIRHALIQNFHFALGRRRGQQSGNAVCMVASSKRCRSCSRDSPVHGGRWPVVPAGHFNFFQEPRIFHVLPGRDGGPERQTARVGSCQCHSSRDSGSGGRLTRRESGPVPVGQEWPRWIPAGSYHEQSNHRA